jgi:hypothetical protein
LRALSGYANGVAAIIESSGTGAIREVAFRLGDLPVRSAELANDGIAGRACLDILDIEMPALHYVSFGRLHPVLPRRKVERGDDRGEIAPG